ncbi:MAG TPA: ATP-binding protein [Streptosporangiaceae bacterium]
MSWLGAAGLVAGLAGLAAAGLVALTVSRPVGKLASTVHRLARGDLAARADVAGSARVRDLARSVNALAEQSDHLRLREQESTRLASAVREAGIRIRAHLDFADVIREAVSAIEEVVPNDAAYLHLVRDGQLGLPEGHEHDWILPAAFADGFRPQAVKFLTKLLVRGTSLAAQDVSNPAPGALSPAQLAMLREAGVQARLVTPFGIGSELFGLIAAHRLRPGQPWTAAEIGAFEAIAADVGRALDHARQYQARNQLVEELQALDRTKSNFIATISHELRTPLTSIAGYVELLREQDAGSLNRTQRHMLDTVARNSDRLHVLIEDLLTLAKIESGTFRSSKDPVDLAEITAQAVAALEPAAAAAGLTLTTSCPPTGLVVNGDAGQLDRVLMNLLSNAVKFTPEGGQVQVITTADGESVTMTVSDTGIGIPQADQPGMFTRFFRASNAIDRSIPGTGLGLSIVRKIAANHGGALDIDSREGRGTTVTLRLPRAANRQPAPLS